MVIYLRKNYKINTIVKYDADKRDFIEYKKIQPKN